MSALPYERRKRCPRKPGLGTVTLSYADSPGRSRKFDARILDFTDAGMGVVAPIALERGAQVSVQGRVDTPAGPHDIGCVAEVRWSDPLPDGRFRTGLVFLQTNERAHAQPEPEIVAQAEENDYYELLQLSPNADTDTIARVFRILAARYHPDNVETGNGELFRNIAEAHRVLTDPERRAAYDAAYRVNKQVRWKIFDGVSVTMGAEAERRKRAGMLSVLYAKRLQEPERPGLTLRELETLLGCPKEHLEFTVWYLKESGCITRADNGRLQITMKGVDAAESSPGVVRPDAGHLITSGTET